MNVLKLQSPTILFAFYLWPAFPKRRSRVVDSARAGNSESEPNHSANSAIPIGERNWEIIVCFEIGGHGGVNDFSRGVTLADVSSRRD